MRCAILIFTFASFLSFVPAKSQTSNKLNESASTVSMQQYFPIGVFEQNPLVSADKERWYASLLTAMEEPSLFEAARNGESTTFRFLLIFGTHSLSVRLALRPDGTGLLTGKLVIVHSDKSNTIFGKDNVLIPLEQVQQFLTLLQKSDFWSLKTEDAKNRYGMDGSQWILEGAKNRTYHVVDRWFPKETDYTRACSYLMNLSPVKLDEDLQKNKAH